MTNPGSYPKLIRNMRRQSEKDTELNGKLRFKDDYILKLQRENVRLRTAFHDAIRRPMGVVPESGEEFYNVHEADLAEERRPRCGAYGDKE